MTTKYTYSGEEEADDINIDVEKNKDNGFWSPPDYDAIDFESQYRNGRKGKRERRLQKALSSSAIFAYDPADAAGASEESKERFLRSVYYNLTLHHLVVAAISTAMYIYTNEIEQAIGDYYLLIGLISGGFWLVIITWFTCYHPSGSEGKEMSQQARTQDDDTDPSVVVTFWLTTLFFGLWIGAIAAAIPSIWPIGIFLFITSGITTGYLYVVFCGARENFTQRSDFLSNMVGVFLCTIAFIIITPMGENINGNYGAAIGIGVTCFIISAVVTYCSTYVIDDLILYTNASKGKSVAQRFWGVVIFVTLAVIGNSN